MGKCGWWSQFSRSLYKFQLLPAVILCTYPCPELDSTAFPLHKLHRHNLWSSSIFLIPYFYSHSSLSTTVIFTLQMPVSEAYDINHVWGHLLSYVNKIGFSSPYLYKSHRVENTSTEHVPESFSSHLHPFFVLFCFFKNRLFFFNSNSFYFLIYFIDYATTVVPFFLPFIPLCSVPPLPPSFPPL